MERTATPTKILLGLGVFKIGDIPIGLTRGGGQFVVEREYRPIVADGDRGNVKGRIQLERSVPRLKMNALEVISENLTKLYPGLKITADTPAGSSTVTGTGSIADTDYNDTVTWTGKTKGGKDVIITLKNAINLENLDWTLAEKDEVIAAVNYEGTYLETDVDGYEPWDVVYVN